MFVAGYDPSNRVTISNTEFDGSTSWSATCDNHHYWTILLDGSNDMITMKGNHIHHTSDQGLKMVGNTLLHAVNNEWYAVSDMRLILVLGVWLLLRETCFRML
jgi:pectin lyase